MNEATMPASWDQFALEAADPYCIDFDEAVERLRPLGWKRLAILGDSVTAGVREPRPGYWDASFADRLRLALAAATTDFEAVNLATPFLRAREIREQQVAAAVAFEPDVVLITAGGNDAFLPFDSWALRDDLTMLLGPLAAAGARVLTVGLFDLPRSGLVPAEHAGAMAARFDELDDLTAAITADLGGIHIDTHRHPLGADPDIYSSDRIHGNARGHAVAFAAIVDTIAPRVEATR
ncbi:SGNH/GDSL hydrolase family protein [Jongsikchunia kroppenstedtii]|uniref:SGNH/GDSL hydrolase family protein n=1 Tax=Jongsikchunia kroppenstedtii TaxID=1121721 RepID=UPI001C9D8675|nr:SGNH/GDSL hydrolase family protein [Jongsikchunia kroppenstedtii]